MDSIISFIASKPGSHLLKTYLQAAPQVEIVQTEIGQVGGALEVLDPAQHTLGVAFLLAALLNSGAATDETFSFTSNFLKCADEDQVKKASGPVTSICRMYAQAAVERGPQALLRSIRPLRCAVEKLRPNPETLTLVHAEFLRVCLKAKAYHLATSMLEQPIFDISLNGHDSTQLTSQSFLCYFYYGALIKIGTKEYDHAMQLLLVVLTCPGSCLSAVQVDAFKKFALLSLKVRGELVALPVYASHIVMRYAKNPGYVQELAEAVDKEDVAAVRRIAEERASQIEADRNSGLVKQVIASMELHKVQTLTKTYLTLSLPEIARELSPENPRTSEEVEALMLDMISRGEINARIDQTVGNVCFEEEEYEDTDMDPNMEQRLGEKMQQILELSNLINNYEVEVVSSESYIKKTMAMEGDRGSAVPALASYDLMDM
mmetsp:Transcript_64405/g.170601  ORF Transcript_64405/g.170601 Transcript_64405/m.170601 type:complete len:432 (-) Transcript_64405:328-1623(-)